MPYTYNHVYIQHFFVCTGVHGLFVTGGSACTLFVPRAADNFCLFVPARPGVQFFTGVL
jgi:heme/copper-type cytochrome/quinol oxidase subunit 3